MKCTDSSCNHCSNCPVREKELVNYLRSIDGHVFTPTKSARHPGHFLTWMECNTPHALGKQMPALCEGVPSLGTAPPICKRGYMWFLHSGTAATRHDLLIHRQARRTEQAQQRQTWQRTGEAEQSAPAEKKCRWPMPSGEECPFTAANSYQMRQHKDKEGHKWPHQSESATKWSVLATAHCGSSDQEANFYTLAVSFVHKKLLTSSVLANESGEISEDSFFFIQWMHYTRLCSLAIGLALL